MAGTSRETRFRTFAKVSAGLAVASVGFKIVMLIAGVNFSLLWTSLMVVVFAGTTGALWRQAELAALAAPSDGED